MAESSKKPGVTWAPFELAIETKRPRCFASSLVLAPRLVKGPFGVNFNPNMLGCCLSIGLCGLVGLVGLVRAANNESEAWEMYFMPAMVWNTIASSGPVMSLIATSRQCTLPAVSRPPTSKLARSHLW